MKKLMIISVLLVFAMQITAQDFAPVGASWHYTQGTLNPDVTSYKTLQSVSDTLINGLECKKIIEVERYFDTTKVFYHYMYSENNKVFFYAVEDFQLLYDFDANAGDTLVLDYFLTHDDNYLKMIIDSTSTITINGQDRKIQYITCGDGTIIEFGHHVIEGIGNTSFMFPTLDGSLDGPLRCYQDNNTALFLNPFHPEAGWNHQDCDEIITGIEEMEAGERIRLFPNPAHSNISINNINEPTAYKIIDINGQMVLQGIVGNGDAIDIEKLSQGIYLVQLAHENQLISMKFTKQ